MHRDISFHSNSNRLYKDGLGGHLRLPDTSCNHFLSITGIVCCNFAFRKIIFDQGSISFHREGNKIYEVDLSGNSMSAVISNFFLGNGFNR